ncbi:Zinc metalloproteinase [Trichostrongylus colubriformis]|uniref:Zinc metalloproteinase n=1 Tax=Trichostrongylus colubriformis TaxID=6319 RepID=A0AAN8F6F3_TRICO
MEATGGVNAAQHQAKIVREGDTTLPYTQEMRLILLLLISSVSIHALDFKHLLEKTGNFVEKLREKTFLKFAELFERTGIISLGGRLAEMRSKMWNKLMLRLPKEKNKELEEKLEKIQAKRRNTTNGSKHSIYKINARKNVGQSLFQSDILLTKQQADEIMEGIEKEFGRDKRQAFVDESYPNTTWQKGVFYRFHKKTGKITRRVFRVAAKQWQEASCINFFEDRYRIANDSIVVFEEDGCWSVIGRAGGKQPLSLGNGCDEVGTALHEIGHALGLYHTMSRYDRDDFITLAFENLEAAFVDEYIKVTRENSNDYGHPYDYGSIMHYGQTSSSKNDRPTMVADDIKYQAAMGSHMLSFIDKSTINDHYKCKEKCPMATSAKCKNNGFPHPRNCSECICPNGYGGALCDERPNGCGATLKAKKEWQYLIDRLGFGEEERDEFTFCNYWIEAPERFAVEIEIVSISDGFDEDGCVLGGVEIKSKDDQTVTGYRFCSPLDYNTLLVSNSSRVPVITFSRFLEHQIVLQYRIAF